MDKSIVSCFFDSQCSYTDVSAIGNVRQRSLRLFGHIATFPDSNPVKPVLFSVCNIHEGRDSCRDDWRKCQVNLQQLAFIKYRITGHRTSPVSLSLMLRTDLPGEHTLQLWRPRADSVNDDDAFSWQWNLRRCNSVAESYMQSTLQSTMLCATYIRSMMTAIPLLKPCRLTRKCQKMNYLTLLKSWKADSGIRDQINPKISLTVSWLQSRSLWYRSQKFQEHSFTFTKYWVITFNV